VGRVRIVSDNAARKIAAVASSGTATLTSTPVNEARIEARPRLSIASTAIFTGSGVRRLGLGRNGWARQPRLPCPLFAAAAQSAACRGNFGEGGLEGVLVHGFARGLGSHRHPLCDDDSVARGHDNFATQVAPNTTSRCAKSVTHLC
jgi:hypothetical protein